MKKKSTFQTKDLSLAGLFLLLFWIGFASSCSNGKEESPVANHPNILLIVADDLGYADLGCYGGDIETPNIDAIAANGIRFSRFHTSPLCAPTRAMLLSGNDNHIAGLGRMGFVSDLPFYEGRLTDRIIPIPALLRKAGYHTYMAGKWHLGKIPEAYPSEKGFEHCFANLLGAGNHYNDQGLFSSDPVTPYVEDGKTAQWEKGKYSTDYYTDKLIEYIDLNKNDGSPFFAFAAYTSPHWPLQVDEKYWKKYEGRYDEGYEVLREKRLASLKQAGMIPKDATLPDYFPNIKPWNSLSPDEKKKESRKMELYAGMVDNLDYNIGRLLNHLKEIGKYDNTLIVFMSDNGAASEDFYYDEEYGPFLKAHFSDSFDSMGKPGSFIAYGKQWAEAGTAPFKYFKGFTTEGGIVTPMIITGPMVEKKKEPQDAFLTLLDLAPTFYELAGVKYPENFEGKTVYPLKGNSLVPFLTGQSQLIHSGDYLFGLEHANLAMIRKGDWKITNIDRPFAESNFKLYNLSNDLAELHDLKEKEPEKFKELLKDWENFSEETHVRIPGPEEND